MLKRLIDCSASEMLQLNKADLIRSIALSEGRVLACETIGAVPPILESVTNAEFAAGMGADLLILNLFDARKPHIQALPEVEPKETIRELKRLTGRIIAVNLEPADPEFPANSGDGTWNLTAGRRATVENARILCEMGADMIVLTGNPGIGVQNRAIVESLKAISNELGDRVVLIAGKMHASGVLSESGEHLITREDVEKFVKAGADVVLFPAPGTVPGITVEYVRGLIEYAHSLGALAMTSVGTSQEGADRDTIRRIALGCKMAGTDIHHLGDSGYLGMSLPENITAYSVAIKGVRHTYRRMARSVNR